MDSSWESVHARKWITSTVADRTSSLPDVSGMYGFAACRPRHERIREPRLRVRQVLHDESRSCGDWSNEISQRQVDRKSVAQPKRTLTSRRPVYRLSLSQCLGPRFRGDERDRSIQSHRDMSSSLGVLIDLAPLRLAGRRRRARIIKPLQCL